MSPSQSDIVARRARWAISGIFFINGAIIGSWAAQIPVAQERLGLSHASLGVALLAMAAGALVAMPTAGAYASRLGSARVTRIATLLFCAAFALPALAPGPILFGAAAFLLGAGNGAMDVAMNAHAVAVEKRVARPVMSSFHGMFSLGGLAGAGAAALLLPVIPATVHALAVAAAGLLAAQFAFLHLLPVGADAQAGGPSFALPNRTTIALGALCFLAFASEGAVLDWSGVHLRTSLDVGPGLAAAGFAAFSATMALGRFGGDWLRGHVGGVTLVRTSALLAAAGLAVSLLAADPLLAITGFAIVGFGMANLVPVLFTVAGKLPGQAPGASIAAVATMGYTGFLAGPPLIGFVAEASSLVMALGLVVLCALLVAVCAGAVREDSAPEAGLAPGEARG